MLTSLRLYLAYTSPYLATVLSGTGQICRKLVLDGERLWQIDFEAAECCGFRDAAQVATQPATQIWSAIEELIITLFLPQPWKRGCSNTPILAFASIRMGVPDVHTEPTGYSSPFKVCTRPIFQVVSVGLARLRVCVGSLARECTQPLDLL